MGLKNRDNQRIANTYKTYVSYIDKDIAQGYVTQKLSVQEYIQAYKELELEIKATGKTITSKSAYIARESRIFSLQQAKEIKIRAQDSKDFRHLLGVDNLNVKNMSIHGFMRKLQERELDRNDLWDIFVTMNDAGSEDWRKDNYSAVRAMYNGVIGE